MNIRLLEILACPRCLDDLIPLPEESGADGEMAAGGLRCRKCSRTYPVTSGIPRFVGGDYASSFGYQWNRFRLEQIDACNGTQLSRTRFFSETEWSKEWLAGKWILDAGCGAGRFLDIASQRSAQVVGVDMTDAVDAARETFRDRDNVHLVQASLYELPFKKGVFDGCYCIGVIQHTPDPRRALQSLPPVLKKGGRLALTIYERKPWTHLNLKYLARPLTKRLPPKLLLLLIQALMPVAFPVTEVLFRLPFLGRLFTFIIPVANYVHEASLSMRQRYRWAVMDTFDMLSPAHDLPQTEREVMETLAGQGIADIHRLKTLGLNIVASKALT